MICAGRACRAGRAGCAGRAGFDGWRGCAHPSEGSGSGARRGFINRATFFPNFGKSVLVSGPEVPGGGPSEAAINRALFTPNWRVSVSVPGLSSVRSVAGRWPVFPGIFNRALFTPNWRLSVSVSRAAAGPGKLVQWRAAGAGCREFRAGRRGVPGRLPGRSV